jgi:hypothetical protein
MQLNIKEKYNIEIRALSKCVPYTAESANYHFSYTAIDTKRRNNTNNHII